MRSDPKKVAIVQSNYIPWKGYFDLINSVDVFVFYDDVQYTRRDWRNRNRIKTSDGTRWLTIPVNVKGRYDQRIKDTTVADDSWRRKHWKALETFYAKAPFFERYKAKLETIYLQGTETFLSEINMRLIRFVCEELGIATQLRTSDEFELLGDKTQRLLGICEQCGGDIYVSGPAARDYFDMQAAQDMGIAVEWFDYSGYPEYDQLFPPFEHAVTVLDLLFNMGDDARKYMKSFQ